MTIARPLSSPINCVCLVCGQEWKAHWTNQRDTNLKLCGRCRAYYQGAINRMRSHQVPFDRIVSLITGNESCWICKRPVVWGESDSVDHDHQCRNPSHRTKYDHGCSDCFRGFVHTACNTRIGGFERLIEDVGLVGLFRILVTIDEFRLEMERANDART